MSVKNDGRSKIIAEMFGSHVYVLEKASKTSTPSSGLEGNIQTAIIWFRGLEWRVEDQVFSETITPSLLGFLAKLKL
jgi:hypothetical protein